MIPTPDDPASTLWRLLIDGPARGSWNMAVDEALLEGAASPGFMPTLRLYAWDPACLSLGHAQPIVEVDKAQLAAFGWDVVRRPTGGRAILHTDELTYSITGSADSAIFQGGILTSYRHISLALLEFLERFYLQPAMKDNPEVSVSHQESVCFEVPSNYEITLANKKIIGSAQARRKNAVLQHGAIPLFGDIARITQVLTYPDAAARKRAADRVRERATNLRLEIGQTVSWQQAASEFVKAFESIHNIKFITSSLTPDELTLARRIEEEKFADPSWTGRI